MATNLGALTPSHRFARQSGFSPRGVNVAGIFARWRGGGWWFKWAPIDRTPPVWRPVARRAADDGPARDMSAGKRGVGGPPIEVGEQGLRPGAGARAGALP